MPRKPTTMFEEKILSIWGGEEKVYSDLEPICGTDLKDKLGKLGVQERNRDRYLTKFTNRGWLEKSQWNKREVAYKPTEKFWDDIVGFKKQLRVSKESLNQVGTYVIEALEKSIMEAEEITDIIEPKVWGYIVSKPEEEQAYSFDEAMDNALKEKPTEKDLKKAYSLLDDLIGNCIRPVADPTVFLRIESKYTLPEIIEENMWNISKSFMTLWDFLYKHPIVISELREYLEKSKPKSNYLQK